MEVSAFMNIGYVKDNGLIKSNEAYKKKLKQLGVNMIYADKQGETIALRDMLKYLRQGDNIIAEDIQDLSQSVGEFIELAISLNNRDINIICKQQQIDTSTLIWNKLFEYLEVFNKDSKQTSSKGRLPRHLETLDECFNQVEQGQITVKEACQQLSIGKSTYYRRWRKVVGCKKQASEKHPEQFPYFESLVAEGKITVTEAAKKMNIGITTYYRMRKDREG